MLLQELIQAIQPIEVVGSTNIAIRNIHFDSRQIEEGDLFVAQMGTAVDGHHFIEGCAAKGAAAVVLSNRQYMPTEVRGSTYIRSVTPT